MLEIKLDDLFQSHLERLAWIIAFTAVSLMSYNHLSLTFDLSGSIEAKTVISLKSADKVPFPAVIIGLGEPVDPAGFLKQSKSAVVESDVDRESAYTN